ncbi:hypothetical protein PCE1_004979 [Barthelona sp. PCE]
MVSKTVLEQQLARSNAVNEGKTAMIDAIQELTNSLMEKTCAFASIISANQSLGDVYALQIENIIQYVESKTEQFSKTFRLTPLNSDFTPTDLELHRQFSTSESAIETQISQNPVTTLVSDLQEIVLGSISINENAFLPPEPIDDDEEDDDDLFFTEDSDEIKKRKALLNQLMSVEFKEAKTFSAPFIRLIDAIVKMYSVARQVGERYKENDELQDALDMIQDLTNENEVLKARNEEKQSNIDISRHINEIDKANKRIKEESEDMRVKYDHAVSKYNNLKIQSRQQVDDYESKLKTSREEFGRLVDGLEECLERMAQLDEMLKRVPALEMERNELKERNEHLVSQLKNAEETVLKEESKNVLLREELSALKSTIDIHRKKLSDVKTEVHVRSKLRLL